MSLRADYHPIPSQNGPDTDGSIRVTISGRLHCGTSVWVQKTGHDRTPVRFWVQREWGRQGWNQMFISSISEVTRDTVKLRKAKKRQDRHAGNIKKLQSNFISTKLSTDLFEFPLHYRCIFTGLAN